MRILASLDTLQIQNDAATPPSTLTGVGSRQGLGGRLYSEFLLELGFHRTATNDSLIDLGTDPAIEWLLKRNSGAQKYDAVTIASATSFTRSAEGSNFIYKGTINLAAPVMEKLLGVDWKVQAEVVTIQTVANVGGSLNGTYFDIYHGTGASDFRRFYFGTEPSSGGGTVVEVPLYVVVSAPCSVVGSVIQFDHLIDAPAVIVGSEIRINGTSYTVSTVSALGPTDPELYDSYYEIEVEESISGAAGNVVELLTGSTASDIASALASTVNAETGGDWSAAQVDDVVTITRSTTVRCGYHDPKTSTFTVTTIQAGMTGGNVTDEERVSLLSEISFEIDGKRQILELFEFFVQNTLRRPGSTNPGAASGSNVRRGSVAIGNGDSSKAVVFGVPFSDAAYFIRDLRVINTTDGSPLNIWPGLVSVRSASGFTVHFNGATDSANYVLEYTCER